MLPKSKKALSALITQWNPPFKARKRTAKEDIIVFSDDAGITALIVKMKDSNQSGFNELYRMKVKSGFIEEIKGLKPPKGYKSVKLDGKDVIIFDTFG